MEAIARLGSALGGGVKTVVDLARMAVGLPPTTVGAASAITLAAEATEPAQGSPRAAGFRGTSASSDTLSFESDARGAATVYQGSGKVEWYLDNPERDH